MSIRCNIKVVDHFQEPIWFYRHNDGNPEVMKPFLNKFLKRIEEGELRPCAKQSSGWLIIMGYEEYKQYQPDWKVGSIEPTAGEQGDIAYLYIVDVSNHTLEVIRK